MCSDKWEHCSNRLFDLPLAFTLQPCVALAQPEAIQHGTNANVATGTRHHVFYGYNQCTSLMPLPKRKLS